VKDDALSQLADPQNLETINEELKQELAYVKAQVENKYQEMLHERDHFMQRLEELKRKK